MDYQTPSPISVQPGQHLCVDSRPGTSPGRVSTVGDFESRLTELDHLRRRPTTHHVSSPFKQGRQKTPMGSMRIDPGWELKRISRATLPLAKSIYKVSLQTEEEIDVRNKTFHTRQRQGRLLPLLGTPSIKGPLIKQCVGITSGNHRKCRKIVTRTSLSFENIKDFKKTNRKDCLELLHRELSIHRNSFNSSHREENDDSSCSEGDESQFGQLEYNHTKRIQARMRNETGDVDQQQAVEMFSRINLANSS